MKIIIDHYTKQIHHTAVLSDVNLELECGIVYGLKGPNGCGKTMLMRAICGLIRPTEGTVSINGETLGKDLSFPRSVGALLENPAFINSYTGFENLKVLASIQNRIHDEEIMKTLDTVGLASAGKKRYRKYSLGMKQRLGIAAAIMESPQLLLLDEPLNALDKDGVQMVHSVIKEFKAKKALIILSCHDNQELLSLADQILCIENGRITDTYSALEKRTEVHESYESN